MLSLLGAFFLKIFGWRIEGVMPQDLKKAVIICGPHTSNWDAFYSLSTFAAMKIKVRFLIKKEALFFPLSILLNGLGAIGVDRKKTGQKHSRVVDIVVDMFKNSDKFYLSISPEGTRKYNGEWKRGFYHIATQANVPFVLGYLDYATKTAGLGPVFYPTGDMEKDIVEIKKFYKNKQGKYPVEGIK